MVERGSRGEIGMCYVKQVNTNKGARPSGQVSSEKERHRQWEKEYSERKREGERERGR